MWQAVAHADLVNFRVNAGSGTATVEEAEAMLKKALAMQDPKSGDAATTMQFYAAMLTKLGRQEEAQEMTERARTIRRERAKAMNINTVGSGAFRVGGGVSAPALLYKVEPAYSEEARAAKYQGTVLLYCEIGPDGRASHIRVLESLGLGLDEQASLP